MKRIFVFCLLLAAAFSCNKSNSGSSGNNYVLTLSNATAKLQQPVYANAGTTSSTKPVVRWSVSPSSNSWISASDLNSVILFSQPGKYTVTANYFADSVATTPLGSSSSDVNVNDSIYGQAPPVCNTIVNAPLLPGDQISVLPLYSADTGMVLVLHTQLLYANSPSLMFTTLSANSGSFSYTLDSLWEYPCYQNNGPSPAMAIVTLGQLAEGTYSLSFKFLGVVYSGSILVTPSQISFTWAYTSGITLSPLIINK